MTTIPPSQTIRWHLSWVFLLLVLLLVAGSIFAFTRSTFSKSNSTFSIPKQNETNPDDESGFVVAVDYPRNARPDFVGPDACSRCHRQIFESFRTTKHPRTCRVVESRDMPRGFTPPNNKLDSVHDGIRFEMTQSGGEYFQTSVHANANKKREHRSRLDLVLGAGGTADDVFLTWLEDGQIRELPMAWLYPSNEWACSHFDPLEGSDFARPTTVRCIECHNTWIEHVIGTANTYRREGALLGVTCESCHGPGGQHVEFHHEAPDARTGAHIVAPGKLSRERRIEICTQCHSNAMRHHGPAFHYKPGEPLDLAYKTIATVATEDDRVANQITNLRKSKCFIADERMTCITCHNPHVPSNPMDSGVVSCAKCHKPDSCSDSHNLPTDVRSKCGDCHMPSYLKININFQTQEDNYVPPIRRSNHQIGIYAHARDEVLLEYLKKKKNEANQNEIETISDRLVSHFTNEAEQCRKESRFLGVVAALREVVRIRDTAETKAQLQQAVKFQTDLDLRFNAALESLKTDDSKKAIAILEEILQLNPKDAKAHGRLGMEYAKMGDRVRAKHHFESVAKCDPNDIYGIAMMAWQAFLDGKFDDSLQLYAQAEELEPREAKMKYQIGLVLLKSNRYEEAIARFKQAIDIEPLHAEAIQALILTFLEKGKASEAIPFAERAVWVTQSQDVNTLAMLGEVYRAAGDSKKAIQAFQSAIQFAASQDPSLVPRIQQELNSLRPQRMMNQ